MALFITFEGLDGSGKSTQLAIAAAHLRSLGRTPLETHEPGGTELGERLRRVFLDPQGRALDGLVEALVVFASRRQHLLEVIEPALAAGSDVVCDRFTDSTVAYQGFGRGVALEEIRRLESLAVGGLRPDLTLLYDLEPEAARRRAAGSERRRNGEIDRLDRERLDFYRRVRQGYLEIARDAPERVVVVDASLDVESVGAATRAALDDFLAGAA